MDSTSMLRRPATLTLALLLLAGCGAIRSWTGKQEALDRVIARTPTKKLATMKDVATATLFLLENGSVNGINLNVDNGWLLT